jgi:ABC-type Zn uptake system ZnuABC Zn-binding protein ZnuA
MFSTKDTMSLIVLYHSDLDLQNYCLDQANIKSTSILESDLLSYNGSRLHTILRKVEELV